MEEVETRDYDSVEAFIEANPVYYRGGGKGHWITEDEDFASEYGKVEKKYLIKDVNLLWVGGDEALEIADELDADDLDLYYQQTEELDAILTERGFDGFENDENIYIVDINIIKSEEELIEMWNSKHE